MVVLYNNYCDYREYASVTRANYTQLQTVYRLICLIIIWYTCRIWDMTKQFYYFWKRIRLHLFRFLYKENTTCCLGLTDVRHLSSTVPTVHAVVFLITEWIDLLSNLKIHENIIRILSSEFSDIFRGVGKGWQGVILPPPVHS